MRFSVVLPNSVHVAALTQPWECGLAGITRRTIRVRISI